MLCSAASDVTSYGAKQAVYDKASDSFVINTPDDTASKFWIGGAGQHGKVSFCPMLLPCFCLTAQDPDRFAWKGQGEGERDGLHPGCWQGCGGVSGVQVLSNT